MATCLGNPRASSCQKSSQHKIIGDLTVKYTYPLNSLLLFRCDLNDLSTRRDPIILLTTLPSPDPQQRQQRMWVLSEHLSKLRVLHRELLEHRLDHLRVLCDHLAEVLDLRAVGQRVEVGDAASSTTAGSSETGTGSVRLLLLLLLSKLKQRLDMFPMA